MTRIVGYMHLDRGSKNQGSGILLSDIDLGKKVAIP